MTKIKRYLLVIFCVAAIVLGALSVYTSQVVTIRAAGTSMIPTIQPGEQVSFLPFWFSEPAPGKVVLISHNNQFIVKRIIAAAGDSVSVAPDGTVTINGVAANDRYAAPRPIEDPTQEAWTGGYSGASVIVPEGCYFVMGDNRAASIDSRDAKIGMIPRSSIIGYFRGH